MALPRKKLKQGDRTRTYLWYKPAAPKGLIVALHGYLGLASTFADAVSLHQQSNFAVAYPDNSFAAWSTEPDSDDEAFIDMVVADMAVSGPVFATGLSAGGCLAYRLGVDRTSFAAIAPVAGRLYDLTRNPQPQRTKLWHIHGADDDFSPYEGNWRVPSAAPGFEKFVDAQDWTELTLVPGGTHEWSMPNFDTSAEILRWFGSLV